MVYSFTPLFAQDDIFIISTSPESCPNACDGSITINIDEAQEDWQPPFDIEFLQVETGNSDSSESLGLSHIISNLCSGVYDLTIHLDEYCTYYFTAVVEEEFFFPPYTTEFTPEGSFGIPSDFQTLLISMETNTTAAYPISVEVIHYATQESLCSSIIYELPSIACFSLILGERYCLVFTDANGCVNESCFVVEGESCTNEIGVELASISHTCEGASEGTITINPLTLGTCGIGSVEWSNGASGASVSGLATDSYCVTVTGDQACSDCYAVQCFDIAEEECDGCEDEIVISGDVTPIRVCSDFDGMFVRLLAGQIDYSIAGGTGNYEVEVTYLGNGNTGVTSLDDPNGQVVVPPFRQGTYCIDVMDDCDNTASVCYDVVWDWRPSRKIPDCDDIIRENLLEFPDESQAYDSDDIEPQLVADISNPRPTYTSEDGYWTLRRYSEGREHDVTYELQSSQTAHRHMYIRVYDNATERRFEHSISKNATNAANVSFTAFPNPFETEVQLNIATDKATEAQIIVHNVLGAQIHAAPIQLEKGTNTAEIALSKYPTGIYTIQLVVDGKIAAIEKVVKQVD